MSKSLIILGQSHDWSKEIELFSGDDHPYGFDCKITYSQEGIDEWKPYGLDLSTEVRHNCTEFHHHYRPGMSAFESDLHSTGGTLPEKEVQSIEITSATKLHNNY